MGKRYRNVAAFLDGAAHIQLTGNVKLIDGDGKIVKEVDLAELGDLEVKLDQHAVPIGEGDDFNITFMIPAVAHYG